MSFHSSVLSKSAARRFAAACHRSGVFCLALAAGLGLTGRFAQAAGLAYVTNGFPSTVSVIDSGSNTVAATVPFPDGSFPFAVAIAPDLATIWVTSLEAFGTCGPHQAVAVVDTATDSLIGSPIPVGCEPTSIAITPDGQQVYVANAFDRTISVINAATRAVVATIPLPQNAIPAGIAITPDGKFAYVTARTTSGMVFVIDTSSNTVLGTPITVGEAPAGIAISPDGKSAYVTDNVYLGSVWVIDMATGVVSNSISVGAYPVAVAFTPDGKFAYVANGGISNGIFSVSVIDALSQAVIGNPIEVGSFPNAVAITADGKEAYVSNEGSGTVSVIDTATNAVTTTINGMGSPRGVAARPLPAPAAAGVEDCQHIGASSALFDAYFSRRPAAPQAQQDSFDATVHPGLVCIENGVKGNPPVTAGWVTFNGKPLLGPSDFARKATVIQTHVNLLAHNSLSVRLASAPGAELRVRVFAAK